MVKPMHHIKTMETIRFTQFRKELKILVEQVITNHTPLKVTHRTGQDFVVMSAEDWERDQETLYVLQNSSLMQQISESCVTHSKPTKR